MPRKPLISIVMPVWNAEDYLAACLESIAAQTLQDFELICVDDGSTDQSSEILDAFSKRIRQMRVFRQHNLGQYRTRNVAWNYVFGDYVLSIDCDDVVESTLLEKVFNRAQTELADITVLGWDYLNVDRRPPDVNNWNLIDWNDYPRKAFPLCFGYMWMKLYRTDFLNRNALRLEERFFSKADIIFHWKSLSLAERIAVVPEVLYHYRLHAKSITSLIGRRRIEIIGVMQRIKQDLIGMDDPKQLLPAWRAFALRMIHSAYQKAPADTRPEFRAEILRFLAEWSDDEQRLLKQAGRVPTEIRFFFLSLLSRTNALRYGWAYEQCRKLGRLLPHGIRSQLRRLLTAQPLTAEDQ